MSFDNSRYTFNPFKDYSSVVMPQGRVQSDADWNEYLAEISRRIQAGTLDTMGRAAYPLTTPDAFYISAGTTPWVVDIGLGRMYVDGLLAENHGPLPGTWDPALEELSGVPQPQPTTVGNTPSIPFTGQPYLPAAAKALSGAAQYLPNAAGSYVYYLDVWKRAVTSLQDPTLVDSAIGIDTSGRMQTVWQVRWMNATPAGGGTAITCPTPDANVPYPPASAGQLSTQVLPNPTSGPCCLTPGTGYTGLENQFYRVQIHQGGPLGKATFKWSRENASVATSVTQIATKGNAAGNQATVLTVTSLGRDQVLHFSNGNWIELLDDNAELDGMPDANYPAGSPYTFGNPGLLCQIDYVDPTTNEIYLVTPPITDARFPVSTPDPGVHTRIVRWDQSGTVYSSNATGTQTATTYAQSTGDIQTPGDRTTMLVLENGIVVTFNVSAASGNFLSGDYWTFAARTDGTLDPPTLTKAPPRGIEHHYTKLSVVTFDGSGNATNTPDCRTQWGCGCEGDCGCCTVTVGDNVNSFGMYSSIQQAIYNLPAPGGVVCILPGKYYELVVLSQANEVTLKGSGPQTILYPPSARPPGTADQGGNTTAPVTSSGLNAVVTVGGSQHIQLTGFTVEAPAGMVCVLLDTIVDDSQIQIDTARQSSIQQRMELLAKKPRIATSQGTLQQVDAQQNVLAGKNAAGLDQQAPGGVFEKIPDHYWPGYFNGQGYGWTTAALLPSNTDVTLDDLILTAANFPAIASVKAAAVEICDNRIFMQDTAGLWPAVYVSGSATTIERNWIGLEDVADASGYASEAVQTDLGSNFQASTGAAVGNGGIQVGGYSNGVSIVENRLEGGAFNAITLGSYLLMNGATPASTLQGLFPATPVTAVGTTTLALPPNSGNSELAADGPLQNIRIEKNQISNCGLCGIGPVGFFTSQSPETVSIANLSILGNTLSGTMQAVPAPLPAALAGTVGYGALCLPDLQNTTIRDNTITDFGSGPGAQVCGIFVLNGEQVEISRNQIVETRDWLAIDQPPATNGGIQGGIAIAMISPPALNQSTSQVWSGSSAQGVTTAGSPPLYQPGLPALRVEQNVVRVPLGYSLTVLGYGPFSITGNHFTTGGTVPWAGGAPPIALNIFVLNLGLPVEFDTVTSFSNLWNYANGAYAPPTLGTVDTALANSTCGTILFAHNLCQVETRGSGAGAPFSSFIATLDHLDYANNLSWMDGSGATVGGSTPSQAPTTVAALCDALLLGITLQVSANRFQEPGTGVLLSALTVGLLNVTASNISTLCLIALGASTSIANNISYYPLEVCTRYAQYLLEAVIVGTLISGATLPETLAGAAAGTGAAGATPAPAPPQPAPSQPAPPTGVDVSLIPEVEVETATTQIPPGQTAVGGSTPTGTTPTATATADTPPAGSTTTTTGSAAGVPKAVSQADSASVAGLKTLQQTQQGRLAQVTRIAAAVTAQSGASSAQATAANAAVGSTQVSVARVAILTQRLSAQAPAVPAAGWGVYGSVYNGSTSAPVQGYSVYFVDSTNTYQNAYGIAYTQADGSYQFVYAGPAAGQTAPTGQLYLQVANASGDPIYTSKTAFVPATGVATYQAITLPAIEKPLGVLPTVLRAVTLPVLEKSVAQPASDTTKPESNG